jgi:Dolichyl-phosphate-mannose-protein mannosyltransferase
MIRRRFAGALFALCLADLLLVVITGGGSFFGALGGGTVGPWGFALRAAVVGLLGVLRFRILPSRWRRVNGYWLALGLFLLPTLVHFQVAGGRINGDGLSYYVLTRSLWKDGDFDLVNEYEHFGMLSRGDLQVPTKTGLRRTIYSVGPAVVWGPFFGLGELIGRADRSLGGDPDLSGYGAYHRNAVALGSLLYGFGALLLIHALLRRYFPESTAFAAVLLVYATTFHYWYMVIQPTYSHAASTFFSAVAILAWARGRGNRSWIAHAGLGLVLGVAMSVRWQNGVLLFLPALDLALGWLEAPRRPLRVAPAALALMAGAFVGASPQMFAWKAIYDYWILPYPPQGPGFVRLHHPFVLETLFSSRHGLFSWTPVFWIGCLGFFPLARRRPGLAVPLLVPFVVMSWVNMGVADYWGGASFSNRRFDSLLPVFALGFAAAIETLQRRLARRPRLAIAAVASLLIPWNLALTDELRRGAIDADDTVAFPRLVAQVTRLASDRVGFPTTWPASWIFAARHHCPPGRYDLVVGRYLFYMQNNLGGRVAVADAAMLTGDWGPLETLDGTSVRRLAGRAGLFASLDGPEDLELRVRTHAAAPLRLRLWVNGRSAGEVVTAAGWSEPSFQVPGAYWQREVNDVALEAADGLRIAWVQFRRTNPGPRRWA